jgi:hypothetical protein
MSVSVTRRTAPLTVRCPRCGAEAGKACVDLRMRQTGRVIANDAPHSDRIKLARQRGRL